MTDPKLQAELEALRAENAELKKKNTNTLTIKVSEKGGVSVYGLGRFPITQYKDTWLKLIELAPTLKQFITDNAADLSSKPVAVSTIAKTVAGPAKPSMQVKLS